MEKLGEGGMGIVYKAQDTKLNRVVALKFLPDRVNNDSTTRSRFLQEAQAAAVLNHPNICVIHDVREEEGKQFMVMEFVEGRTLREVNGQRGIATEKAVDYAVQIAEALEEAHSKGIVHRDIKADNIMINAKDQVKVMDFGLAKLKGSLKLTRTSSTVGTLAYMAPEQMQGGEVDPRSDIFAFGVLFFEMLTGRLPFRGEHEAAMMYSIINEDPEELTKYLPDAPPELSFLLRKSLEKNPEDRYQQMSDIVRDLRRLKKQSSRVNRPAYSGEYRKLEAERPVPAGSGERTPAPQKKKPVFLYGGIGALLLIAAAVIVYTFFPGENTAFSSFQFSRITSTGNVQSAAISSDNRYICYSQFDKGKYSLWVRQLATSSNIQIRVPQQEFIGDPIFSNDGNFIYYRMLERNENTASLFKIPVLGGNSVKVIANVQGSVTFSPDGSQFAFNRVYQETGNFALVIASADGSKQKDLVAYKGEKWISGAPFWSPKGDIIAVALGLWEGGFHHELISVHAVTGEVQKMSEATWDVIREITWLSDGEGLIVEGTDMDKMLTQLYFVGYPSGRSRRITNDLNDYGGSSVTDDRKKICAVQSEREIYLYHVPDGDAQRAVKLTQLRDDGMNGLAVSTDNRIYFTSRQGGAFDIWSMSLSGEDPKQVTADESGEQNISVTPDGSKVLFSSSRSGLPNIWSIRTDGSGLTQLTKDAEDYFPSMDVTGKWIVFSSWMRGPNTVMRIPAEGGERLDVTTENGNAPVLSPDGKTVYFIAAAGGKRYLSSIPLAGGTATRLFEVPPQMTSAVALRPNFKEFSYVLTNDGVSNIYTRPIGGGPQKQFTRFNERSIISYAWTADGRSVVASRGEVRSDVVILNEESE
ncbi:MAG: protein kinase [Bacteroidetes bacterium]|nr:protein kinase [Bacteroidota bacterium]